MTNSTDRAQQQLAAGLALADLLTHAHRLPPIYAWSIEADGPVTIRGQLGQACDGLAAIRGALTEWANTLDNPTWTTRRYTGYDGGQIAVTGTYMGQSVTIWEGLTAGQLAEVGDAVRSAA